MSMSSYVCGYREADEKWNEMMAIWQACAAADIDPPKEVKDFFCGEDPTDKPGMEVEIDKACTDLKEEHRQGIEVDLQKLPPHVRRVRFYNAW